MDTSSKSAKMEDDTEFLEQIAKRIEEHDKEVCTNRFLEAILHQDSTFIECPVCFINAWTFQSKAAVSEEEAKVKLLIYLEKKWKEVHNV